MSEGLSHEAAVVEQNFAAAHRALKADSTIQFDLPPIKPPTPPPQWWRDFLAWLDQALAPIGRFFSWISSWMPDAPYARIFLWTVLALAAAALLWLVFERVRYGSWRLPRRRRAATAAIDAADEEWMPEAAPAREWLREADALAEQGRFADAAHHLLMRSVEDIARRRPGLVRPAVTSRDLARADAVPVAARGLFADIAAVVERSLFGGRPVDAGQWAACRAAYADFARGKAWAR